jgi:hypothetical protein
VAGNAIDDDAKRGYGGNEDAELFSSLLPASEWPSNSATAATDGVRLRLYSPHAMSEPAASLSGRRRIAPRNRRHANDADDVDDDDDYDDEGDEEEECGGSLDRHRCFSDTEESHMKGHQGPGSAVHAALMHQFCPPSPAPQDPDDSDNEAAVLSR